MILGKFLRGFPTDDGVVPPEVQVVSLYIDQVSGFQSPLPGLNEGFRLADLGHFMARKHGLRMCGSIREALCCGTESLAVDGVLLIGEHGDYPLNELGQQSKLLFTSDLPLLLCG